MTLWYAHTDRTLGELALVLEGLVAPRDVAHLRCSSWAPCVRVEVLEEREPAVRRRLEQLGLVRVER